MYMITCKYQLGTYVSMVTIVMKLDGMWHVSMVTHSLVITSNETRWYVICIHGNALLVFTIVMRLDGMWYVSMVMHS